MSDGHLEPATCVAAIQYIRTNNRAVQTKESSRLCTSTKKCDSNRARTFPTIVWQVTDHFGGDDQSGGTSHHKATNSVKAKDELPHDMRHAHGIADTHDDAHI